MKGRLVIGAAGLVVGVYGGWLLVSRQDHDQLVSAGTWLVAGVVLHDFVLAPLVILAVAAGGRALPAAYRGPAAGGLVVLGAATLLAIPVLGSFGAQAHNPSLLDRHYVVGWLVLAGLVLGGVLVAGRRRGSRPGA